MIHDSSAGATVNKSCHPDSIAFSHPMQEVAQILATGILRLKHREQNAQRWAANVSDKGLDVCAEKSVNVTSQLGKRGAGQRQNTGS